VISLSRHSSLGGCEIVPDPKLEYGRDAIVKVTACAICGSDLHLLDGVMPSMEKGESSIRPSTTRRTAESRS
jgi:threonine dehydrogenase-like Zn-dependent dehydrogenase